MRPSWKARAEALRGEVDRLRCIIAAAAKSPPRVAVVEVTGRAGGGLFFVITDPMGGEGSEERIAGHLMAGMKPYLRPAGPLVDAITGEPKAPEVKP